MHFTNSADPKLFGWWFNLNADIEMLGAIIGDIVGSTREWNNVKTEDFELLPKGSTFTDDSVMTLAVAEWLMSDPEHKAKTLVECMRRLGWQYPNAGYGGMFRRWLASAHPKPYGSFGNGSAMRVSPVGLYARSMGEALDLAELAASVTHNHPEGIKGAQAIAACVYMRTEQRPAAEIKQYVEEVFGYDLSVKLETIREAYAFDVSCQGSVPIAIMAFLQRSDSVEKALRLAVSMGGDSDTIGCMTCAIASALPGRKGIGHRVQNACRELLTPDLLDINDRFEALVSRRHQECPPKAKVGIDALERPEAQKDLADSIRGCLMGGAAGDALGYPVEFKRLREIRSRYGEKGIAQFELDANGKALVSDDTQMTLFTANGLLMGMTRGCMRGIGLAPEKYVDLAYVDWYYTQTGKKPEGNPGDFHATWLRDLPEMRSWRAPGGTCLAACESLLHRQDAQNDSKGCGGIMRVAPMALMDAAYSWRGDRRYTLEELADAGAGIARITHKHPLGFFPAALLTVLLAKVLPLSARQVERRADELVDETLDVLGWIFVGLFEEDKQCLRQLTRKAVELAHSDVPDTDAIRQLGEGWTGEETWAIALYCALRHMDSVEEAIVAAVNHDGDSDSTGSVTGNIMGAIYGYQALKERNLFCPPGRELEQTLELSDIILALADDLATRCPVSEYSPIDTPEKHRWYERYCEMRPAGLPSAGQR